MTETLARLISVDHVRSKHDNGLTLLYQPDHGRQVVSLLQTTKSFLVETETIAIAGILHAPSPGPGAMSLTVHSFA